MKHGDIVSFINNDGILERDEFGVIINQLLPTLVWKDDDIDIKLLPHLSVLWNNGIIDVIDEINQGCIILKKECNFYIGF